jgi:hypothetical protein
VFTYIYSFKLAHILLKALICPNCIVIITKIIRSLDALSAAPAVVAVGARRPIEALGLLVARRKERWERSAIPRCASLSPPQEERAASDAHTTVGRGSTGRDAAAGANPVRGRCRGGGMAVGVTRWVHTNVREDELVSGTAARA